MATRTLLDGWNRHTIGGGGIVRNAAGLRFFCPPAVPTRYTNAQIDDYQGLSRRDFPWKPPLTLTVCARFSHPSGVLRGTAGFGFWNDPFMMTGWRPPTLPQAIWFFYASMPSDMALAAGVPGNGWKAATIDATGWRALGGLLLAPPAAPLMHVSRWHRRLWPFFQHSFRVTEAPIPALMTEWHEFVLNWSADSVVFVVDGEEVLHSPFGQAGPLGFVGWLDNQWMIVRPTGRLGHGTLTLSMPQWMEIAELRVVNG